jgi:hypothetical protein
VQIKIPSTKSLNETTPHVSHLEDTQKQFPEELGKRKTSEQIKEQTQNNICFQRNKALYICTDMLFTTSWEKWVLDKRVASK